jgi:hypothetical protein
MRDQRAEMQLADRGVQDVDAVFAECGTRIGPRMDLVDRRLSGAAA